MALDLSIFVTTGSRKNVMKSLFEGYSRFSRGASSFQSPFLLSVRLYWGWQFAQTGWGKMHNIAKITGFFTSLNIPFPAANAHFVSGLEDPGKFYVADPYTFLFASLMVLIFGAGLFSVDRLLASRVQDQTTKAR